MYNLIYLSTKMDLIKNPYSPGAGSPPPELVGRDPILEQARILIGRIKNKRSEKSMLLTGLRGVGKTVLLNEIDRMAKESGCQTISIEAHENKALGPMVAPYLRSLLFDLEIDLPNLFMAIGEAAEDRKCVIVIFFEFVLIDLRLAKSIF